MQHQNLILTPDLQIRKHPIIRHIPDWAEEDPRYIALRDSVQRHGLVDAIKLTANHQVIDPDSWMRYQAAKAWKLAEIPVDIIPEDQAGTISLATFLHRRHLTKNQKAYLGYPIIQAAWEESKRRRVENLRKGQQSPEKLLNSCSEKTLDDFAQMLGVSPATLKLAKRVHDLYAEHPEYKDKTEVMVLAETDGGEHEQHRPMSLHGVLSGFGGKNAPQERRGELRKLDLFKEGLKIIGNRFGYWEQMDPGQRAHAKVALEEAVMKMPQGLCDEFASAIRAAKHAAKQV